MLILRLYLLSGLIIHKVVWELLRNKSEEKPKEWKSPSVTLVKLVKIGILVGVLIQTLLPDILPIASEPYVLRVAGTAVYTLGLLVAIAARFQLGDNWANIETGQVLVTQQVVDRGIYGLIRHPIYTGDLLLLLGLELALNSWLFVGVFLLAPAVMIKAIAEEKMLVRKLPGYDDYCSRTKRFVPFLF